MDEFVVSKMSQTSGLNFTRVDQCSEKIALSSFEIVFESLIETQCKYDCYVLSFIIFHHFKFRQYLCRHHFLSVVYLAIRYGKKHRRTIQTEEG